MIGFKLRKVHPGKTISLELEARRIPVNGIKGCDVSPERLQDYVDGKVLLENDELRSLANALGVTYSFLKKLQLNYERD